MTHGELEARMEILRSINDIFISIVQDENLIEIWLRNGIPDGATTFDLLDIAEDDELFCEILDLFARLIKNF